MLPIALFSSTIPAGDRHALAESILQHKPDLPLQVAQQRFGNGFGKPIFPVLSPATTLADLEIQTAGLA